MTLILVGESRFAPAARAVLERAGEVAGFDEFEALLPEADAVVLGLEVHLKGELLARAEKLRVIATRTSQLRHLDVDEATRRGIDILFIEPGAQPLQDTASTAEETWALLLALVRNVPWAFDSVKAGRWERFRYGGNELRGKTLGLIGYGRLGRMVARYGEAFGMRVLAFDPYVDEATAAFQEVMSESDVVSIHCTWSDETCGMIGAMQLAWMKPGSVLVNTARGEIVDEEALLDALSSGHLAGAAVDTLAGELPDGSHVASHALVAYAREHENLIVLPHLGGATEEATERTQVYISERLVDWLAS